MKKSRYSRVGGGSVGGTCVVVVVGGVGVPPRKFFIVSNEGYRTRL